MEPSKMNRILQGWRKTGYWLLSVAALTGGAYYMKSATFAEYRDGLVVLAGLVLAGHVYQQAKVTAGDPK
jgi:hypothetical protein